MASKQVVVELRVKMLVDVPEDWDKDSVESWMNESSHCLGTEIEQLWRDEEKATRDHCCFTCHRATSEYLRDATPSDIANLTYHE